MEVTVKTTHRSDGTGNSNPNPKVTETLTAVTKKGNHLYS